MIVYIYDKNTFEFLYEDKAQLDPLESHLKGEEVYLIPANSTTTAPLICEANSTNVFNVKEQKWNIVKDFRGMSVYNKKSGKELVVNELGELPEGYVIDKPFNAQLAKIEAMKVLNNLYNKAYSAAISINKVKVKIDDRNELVKASESLDDIHNTYFLNTDEEAIELTKDELIKITDSLYERSIQLPTLKNEFVKKIKACKAQSSINKVIEEARKKLI